MKKADIQMTWPAHKRNGFTLVEMVVAMAVLVILMLLLFRFLAGAQQAWSLSKANTRVYENARVALELIRRELLTAVASNESGRQIPFQAGNPCTFISATNISSTSSGPDCKLTEVRYHQSSDTLYREATDFGGTSADEEVVNGVDSFSMACFDSSGSLFTGSSNELPAFVQVSITLFDEALMDLPAEVQAARKPETMRTFTKIIFLQ